MYETILTAAGLTRNEAKVYLTLLKIGKCSSGKIVKAAQVAGGKIYETLYKLIDKGLVEVVIENGIKQFCASNAESILLYLKERENRIHQETEKLTQIIPEFQKLQAFHETPENVYLVKGFRGIRPLVYKAIQESVQDAKIMGIRSSKDTKFNIFWQHWHRERVRLKKKARMLFTDRNTGYWNFFKNLKVTEIKSIPTTISPSAIMIIDNQTFIFSYDLEFTCIHIRSRAIAKSFASFFDGLWEIGES